MSTKTPILRRPYVRFHARNLAFHCFIFLIGSFLFFPCAGKGQEPTAHFDLVNEEDGLSGQSITAIYQDRKGFLWVGTYDQGLNRFDGNEVKTFRHSQRDSNSLCSDMIRSILEDEKGNIWVGTEKGVSRLNPNNGHCDNYLQGLGTPSSTFLMRDPKGTIWSTSGNGLSRFNPKKEKFDLFLKDDLNRSAIAKDGVFWLGGGNGLSSFDPLTSVIHRYYPFPEVPSNAEKNRLSVKIDSYGNIWVFSWGGGLLRFHPETGRFDKFIWVENPKFPSWVNIAFDTEEIFDKNGKRVFWICAEHGLFRFPLESGDFPSLDKPHTVIKPKSHLAPEGWQACESIIDHQGNLWFGANFGLYRYKKEQEYTSSLKMPKESSIGQVFFAKNGDAFISSNYRNPLRMVDANLHWNKINKKLPAYLKDCEGEICTAVAKEESNGYFYVGTRHGLSIFDRKKDRTLKFKYDQKDSTSIAGPKISFISPLSNGLLLLGFWKNGLQVFDVTSGKGIWRFTEANGNNPCCVQKIGDLIWIGTEWSLYTFDPKKRTMTEMVQPSERGVQYMAVLKDRKERIWLGTNHGFCQLDIETHQIRAKYDAEDGLPGMEVNSMAEDSLGRIWMNASRGLCIFNPKTWKIYCPDKHILNGGELWPAPNGDFWMTSDVEIKIFNPVLFRDPRPSKVYLTGLKINEKDTLLSIPFDQVKELRLSPGQNALTFSFSAIDLNDFGKTRFRYLLEGLQTEWVSAGKSHRAAFVNLKPGVYTFRIHPEDAGEDPFYDASLRFVVTDYFWQRLWFKIAGFTLLGVLLISLAFLEYTRRLRLRNLRLQARLSIQEERNRISRDLHDDLGSSLGAISLLSDLVLSKAGNKGLHTEVRKIADSAHELSEKIHEIIWAANPQNDTLERFVSYLHQYAASLLEDGHYDLRAQIPRDIPPVTIAGDHRRALFLGYKEALNNIIRHANATLVEIHFVCSENSIEIYVRDNGQGFQLSEIKHAGNGLTNMQKRMEDIGGAFSLQSSESGTTVVFQLQVA